MSLLINKIVDHLKKTWSWNRFACPLEKQAVPITGNQSLAERAPRSNHGPRSAHRFSANACPGTGRGWDAD